MPALSNDADPGEETCLFVYGTLRQGAAASPLMAGCRRLGAASVKGTLYDVNGRFPALALEGETEVSGEVWACPAERLPRLDAYEGVESGLYRRVLVQAGGRSCWTYVAGPGLRLHAAMVVPSGRWEPPAG